MKKFQKLSNHQMNLLKGGRRVVEYKDVDRDGDTDKVVTIYRNGKLKRVKIKYNN